MWSSKSKSLQKWKLKFRSLKKKTLLKHSNKVFVHHYYTTLGALTMPQKTVWIRICEWKDHRSCLYTCVHLKTYARYKLLQLEESCYFVDWGEIYCAFSACKPPSSQLPWLALWFTSPLRSVHKPLNRMSCGRGCDNGRWCVKVQLTEETKLWLINQPSEILGLSFLHRISSAMTLASFM